MLMQPKSKQAEIEKAQVKSLAVIAFTFLAANIFLLITFTANANAQVVQPASAVIDLARMLAAPETTTTIPFITSNAGIASVMTAGLVAMAAASIFFLRNFARNMDHAARTKI